MPELIDQNIVIKHGGEQFTVLLEFNERKHLSITVHPDGTVIAKVPFGRTLDDVQKHLNQRRSWIAKQRRHFEKFQPMPLHKRYLPGETHLYLGRQYRLRVKESEDKSVKLIGSFFYVMTPTPKQPQAIEDAMKLWYHSHAADIFGKRIEHCFTIAPSIRLHSNVAIRVRKMERRWGSCSQSGIITLNTDLVKTPIHCIDYVIMHELCHLSIHNHSPAFYRLLGRCMPDWKTRKDRLESMVIR